MLSIAAMGSGSAKYYTLLAKEDYYLDGGEPPGVWHGSGARRLGLSQVVEAGQLLSLFRGVSPSGRSLVQNAGKENRQPGWDFTFSAPKSLSVLWSQADLETRRKIQDILKSSVTDALAFLEGNYSHSRTGKSGQGAKTKAGLVIAAFEHSTSRALDPQLHWHCLVLNLGVDGIGNTRSLISKEFYNKKMLLGAYFRLALASRIEKELGLSVSRPLRRNGEKANYFELPVVPKPLCDHFSKRRKEMERELEKYGVETASAAAVAALKTRSVKDLIPPRGELLAGWKREGLKLGFSFPKLQIRERDKTDAERVSRALDDALESITSRHSHFTESDLLTETFVAAAESPLSPLDVVKHVRKELSTDSNIVPLGDRDGVARYSTKEIIAIEKELLSDAATLSKQNPLSVFQDEVENAITRKRTPGEKPAASRLSKLAKKLRPTPKDTFALDPEQAAAVRYLTDGKGSIKCVSGVAGAGKTTLLQAAREAFEASGYKVIGTALSGRAAKVLEKESGIKSDTIRMRELELFSSKVDIAAHHAKQILRAAMGFPTWKRPPRLTISPNTVLVVDEAGMVGTRDMALLVKAVKKGGGTLVLIGDRKQLPSIEAGGAFGSLSKRFGSVHLETSRRHRSDWERDAATHIRRGEAEKALNAYAEKGQLLVAETDREAATKLLRDWTDRGGATAPSDHVIVAATNAQVDHYNEACQSIRKKYGQLRTKSVTVSGTTLHEGDRVMIRVPVRSSDIQTGLTGTLVRVGGPVLRPKLSILFDGEKKPRRVSKKDLERAGRKQNKPAMSLGYAGTVHRYQGATVKHSYWDATSSMTNKELGYVAGTRQKDSLRIYTNEKVAGLSLTNRARAVTGGGPKLNGKKSRTPVTSVLEKQLKKSAEKTLAHDVSERRLRR